MINRILAACAGVAFCTAVGAQQPMAVTLRQNGADMVGGRLGYAVKEALRRSAGMRWVESPRDASVTVVLSTLAYDQNNAMTVYGVAWLGYSPPSSPYDYHLDETVGFCGASRVNECADSIVAVTDQVVASFRKRIGR
jgi:hypothetical protein